MTVLYRSELHYGQQPEKVLVEGEPKLSNRLQRNIEGIIEYPGSREKHEWYLVSWVEAKIDKILVRGGTERK